MAYLGSGMEEVEKTVATINMVCDTMVGDGSTTTMTIGATQEVPGSVNNVSVYFDGVCQRPTTDYTLSYKTVTFTTAPENAVKVICLSYANEFLDVISDATVYSTGIEDNAVTAAKLGSTIASSKLTGTLPALDGSALTGVGVTPITTSASDPLITTNPSGGLGTIFANTTSGEMYVLTDATAGANVWINVGSGEGDVPYVFQGTTHGYTAGGNTGGPFHDTIDKFTFASDADATDVGNLTIARQGNSGQLSGTHGYTSGGYGGPGYAPSNIIDKYAFVTDGNATDVGNLTQIKYYTAGQSSEFYGYVSGGYVSYHNVIDKITFASDGNASDIGNLTVARYGSAGHSSGTHGYTGGGTISGGSSDVIDKFTVASDADATDVGNLTVGRHTIAGQSSSTHGYSSGGVSSNVIDKFTFASDADATDVGNLTVARTGTAGQSSTTHGYATGGNPSLDVIEKFTFASDADATDVGNLTVDRTYAAGTHV
jgi:hypothetical protein